jgi:hypothetical protein
VTEPTLRSENANPGARAFNFVVKTIDDVMRGLDLPMEAADVAGQSRHLLFEGAAVRKESGNNVPRIAIISARSYASHTRISPVLRR